MHSLLIAVPLLPLLGAVVLMLGSLRLAPAAVRFVGIGSVGLSAFLAGLLALHVTHAQMPVNAELWQWIRLDGFDATMRLHLDGLSVVMMLIITAIGFLIHLYSGEYMAGDEGYARFFAYLNLFIAAMLILVLADDLLLLYVGWEGVGLCSYLLIGFWWREPENGAAARKAFIVTRIGDTAFIIGLLLLAARFQTLSIAGALHGAQGAWSAGSMWPTLVCFLLLGGAVGKSAQLPLQTWLPDAMAGPTPVSALIHAATMVTAGVYLIARTHALFLLAPAALGATGLIGAATLLIAAVAALAQTDIKRVLAYSTISQIGYMFLALGVHAWTGAIFHLATHAFFKALLFLTAGAIILRLHHEQDMRRMGGLARTMPGIFACFLIGSASLAALPMVTAGFYSKETILGAAWEDGGFGKLLWCAGVAGAFLTALYIFRATFSVFLGDLRSEPHGRTGSRIAIPLAVLAVLALVGGFMQIPRGLGMSVSLLSRTLSPVFGTGAGNGEVPGAGALGAMLVASLAPLAGLLLAWTSRGEALVPAHWATFMRSGLGFDALYARLFVAPFDWLVHALRPDGFDLLFDRLAQAMIRLHGLLSLSQTGRVRWYAGWVAAGSLAALTIAVLS